jgi:hypothetical protein
VNCPARNLNQSGELVEFGSALRLVAGGGFEPPTFGL